MAKDKNGLIGLALIVLLVAGVAYFMNGNKLAIAGIQGLNQSTPVSGSTILSLGQIQVYQTTSSPLSGLVWFVNLVANNGGQSLTGTTTQIAQAMNSSYSASGQTVFIDAKLQSESYQIPYVNTGMNINNWEGVSKTVSFTASNQGKWLDSCQGTYTASSGGYQNIYDVTCTGTDNVPALMISQVNAFNTACASQNTNAHAFYINYVALSIGFGYEAQLLCVQPVQYPVSRAVYNPTGTINVAMSALVTFSNGTSSPQTLTLTNIKTQGYLFNNNVFAQIYGYSVNPNGGQIDLSQAPTILIMNSTGLPRYTNPIPASYLLGGNQQYNNGQFPASWYSNQYMLVAGGQNIQSSVYDIHYLNAQINDYNNNIMNVVLAPVQSSNFYTSNIGMVNGTYVASINLINNSKIGTPYSPEIQVIAKLDTLGVVIVSAQPNLVSISPNPVPITSGATAQVTFTVLNQGNVQAAFYVSGNCGNLTFATNQFQVAAGKTGSQTITLQSPFSLNKTLSVSCTATAYSVNHPELNSTKQFGLNVAPVCSASSVYYNTTTCKPFTTVTTTATCAQTGTCPVPPNGIGLGWYIIGIGTVIVVAIILATHSKGGRRTSVRRR